MNKAETASRLRRMLTELKEVESECQAARKDAGMDNLCEELETLLQEASDLLARSADLLTTTAG